MNIIETDWKWNSGLTVRSATNYIALHHAAVKNCTASQIHQWHKANGWAGIGYHFFVTKEGNIFRGRPIWAVGAHVQGRNSVSVGVCAEGDYSTENIMPYAQKNAIKEVISYLKDLYPAAQIVGHGEIGSSECPGKYYPLEEMKNYKTEEDISMERYNELKNEIKEIKSTLASRVGYYNYIDNNINPSYRPTLEKLVKKGILKGNENGELMLTEDMMRILTILDRSGIFN